MERSFEAMMASLADNNTGRIGPQDIRAIVDSLRTSAVVETFSFTADEGLEVPFSSGSNGWGPSEGDSTGKASLPEDTTDAPAWFWLRPRLVAGRAAAPEAKQWSRVSGLFSPTAGGEGYAYVPPRADPSALMWGDVAKVAHLSVSLIGSTAGANARGALVLYRSTNGNWPSGASREVVIPFDTGTEDLGGGVFPLYASGIDMLLLEGNDDLRLRLEYYGNSSGGGTGTISSVRIKQFSLHLATVATIEPPPHNAYAVSVPDSSGYTDAVWRADGVSEAARDIV